MKKRSSRKESLISEIETALDLGNFISYGSAWEFTSNLEEIGEKLTAQAKKEKSSALCELYEMFLAGCYEKSEEIDDSSGSLGDFFQTLFCDWICARQWAGADAEETVELIFRWMENDNYGYLYMIEQDLADTLNAKSLKLFIGRVEDKFERAFSKVPKPHPDRPYDFPSAVRQEANILKKIYQHKNKYREYKKLCERLGTTPKDCEALAQICKRKKRDQDALEWVQRGEELEENHEWRNETAYGLSRLRKELLHQLGRTDEVVPIAWEEFEKHPSSYSYETLMNYVPTAEHSDWHKKAMEVTTLGPLQGFIAICTETQELSVMAQRVRQEPSENLERESHYLLQPAAEALGSDYPLAAAKLFSTLGLRIVNAKKSKYYHVAFAHLRRARELYLEADKEDEWNSLVTFVRAQHTRKYSFIGSFEEIVAGVPVQCLETFVDRARKRWEKQTK